MKLKRAKNLLLLTPVVLAASITPLLVTSCGKQQPTNPTKPSINIDKRLSYHYFSTFKIENKDNYDGYWVVSVNDVKYDISKQNFRNEYFSIINKTNSELIIQPNKPTNYVSNDDYIKYEVSYNSNSNKCLYKSASFLNISNDINIRIIEGDTIFTHNKPTIKLEAYSASTGNDLNVEWSYELKDKSVQSYLRYFSVIESGTTTTMTLIKNDIPENTIVWVYADDGQSKAMKGLQILSYIPPQIEVDTAGHTKLNLNEPASFSINFLSGSTTLQNFVAGWNIYTLSGQPINVDKDGRQIPITKYTLEDVPCYENNLLFLSPSVSKGQKGIDNEQITLKLNPYSYIPSYSGIKIESIIMFTSDYKTFELVSTSEQKVLNYDNQNYLLSTINGDPTLCDLNDTAEIEFICRPYEDYNNYLYEVETTEAEVPVPSAPDPHTPMTALKFTGYKDQINKEGGTKKDNGWYDKSDLMKKDLSPAQTLLRVKDYAEGSETYKINPTQPLSYDPLSGKYKISVKLENCMYLPIKDSTGTIPEIRDVDFAFNIKIYRKIDGQKGNFITSFPLNINVLNKNRVLSSKQFTLENDEESKATILNLHQYNDQSTHGGGTKEFWTNIEPWQCELYLQSNIKTIKRTKFDRSSVSKDVKEYQKMINILKYVSFAKDNVFETIADADDNNEGVFEYIITFRNINLGNCKHLKRIGNRAFFQVGSASDASTLNSIIIPDQAQDGTSNKLEIGEEAFAQAKGNEPNLQTIVFGSGKFNRNIIFERQAFYGSKNLNAVEFNYESGSNYNIKIKESAFENCSRLSLFNFRWVSQISSFAFWNCQKLTNLDFSRNLNSCIFNDDDGTEKGKSVSFEGKGVFGYYNEETEKPNVTLNIQLAEHDSIIEKPDSQGNYYNVIGGADGLYNWAAAVGSPTPDVSIGNFSSTYDIYEKQTASGSENFKPRKLELYDVSESKSSIKIDSTVEELTFSSVAAEGWGPQPIKSKIEFTSSSNIKLRVLTFNKVGISPEITGQNPILDLNVMKNIETFVLIAPEIGKEEKKIDYCTKILKQFFPLNGKVGSEKENNVSTWLSNYPRNKILNINLKLSLGSDDEKSIDLKTYEEIQYYLISQRRLAYLDGSNYIYRGYMPDIDLMTHVTWILW